MTSVKKIQRHFAKGLVTREEAMRQLTKLCFMSDHKAQVALRVAIGVL